MKTYVQYICCAVGCLIGVHEAAAQLPIITSFSQNGVLVCSNLAPASVASVQWASSLSGPWQSDWAGLTNLTVGSNGIIQVSVPMFFRVVSTPPPGLALIPAGAFTMGDTLDGESDAMPTVSVTLSDFYVDINLVTYSQWQSVYNWATTAGYSFDNTGLGKMADHPVQTVDWYDVVKWCNARSQQAGLTPVYYADAGLTQVYMNGDSTPYVKWTASGFRLPTEAEWEKASRGGVSGARFPFVGNIRGGVANYFGCTSCSSYDLGPDGYSAYVDKSVTPYTSPVGFFSAYYNGYGLYDMAGNVFEWCWDWYGTPYGQPTTTNPTGPTTGSFRVLRGGSWHEQAYYARCAGRQYQDPSTPSYTIGFRCVRAL
jgi:formylglycine-generating enzyme required for sulfatase activity